MTEEKKPHTVGLIESPLSALQYAIELERARGLINEMERVEILEVHPDAAAFVLGPIEPPRILLEKSWPRPDLSPRQHHKNYRGKR